MAFRQGAQKARGEIRLFLGARIYFRRQSVRGERRQSSILRPSAENARILEKFRKIDFMVAFEAHHAMGFGALDQQIQNRRGVPPPVDVIAEKYVYCFGYGVVFEVLIDPRKQSFE